MKIKFAAPGENNGDNKKAFRGVRGEWREPISRCEVRRTAGDLSEFSCIDRQIKNFPLMLPVYF